MADRSNFAVRYGQWAVVAGASEGLGSAYAKELAVRGLNLVLIARRAELLQTLGSNLAAEFGIEMRTIALDLSAPDAPEQIARKTEDIEVGLLVYNAAFSVVGPFLERPMGEHLKELQTNVHAPLKLLYLLGQRMLTRKHGGVVLMSSLSAFQGSPYISTYAATKAFIIVMAEGLWDEWRALGVDVLVCISGTIRTPNYLASVAEQKNGVGNMTLSPDQVAHEALNALGKQPYVIPGRINRISSFVMRHFLSREAMVKFMGRILRRMYVEQN